MKFAELINTPDGNQILGIIRYEEETVLIEAITVIDEIGLKYEMGRFPKDQNVQMLYDTFLSIDLLLKIYQEMFKHKKGIPDQN